MAIQTEDQKLRQRAYMREFRRKRIEAGLCPQCYKGATVVPGRSRCASCLLYQRKGRALGFTKWTTDRKTKELTNARRHAGRQKAECYRHYGHGQIRCACCGEREIAFLSIDHINGGGTKQRRDNPKIKVLYEWLRQQGYPPGYQVLCMNCNKGKYTYGECPHQLSRERGVI